MLVFLFFVMEVVKGGLEVNVWALLRLELGASDGL